MSRFVVMSRTAKMPSTCKGRYCRVAVVETDLPEGEPASLDPRDRHVLRIVETWERLHVGTTDRCAYRKALAEAEALAEKLGEAGMTITIDFQQPAVLVDAWIIVTTS